MPATDLCHCEEDRPLSIEEYKRLQEFPDDWRLAGKLASQYRQIGNAVPTSLAEAAGRHLLWFDGLTEDERLSLEIIDRGSQYSRYRNTDHEYFSQLRGDQGQPGLFPFDDAVIMG
jgi:DNA (cytosine-5)-methyltransferase 1